MIWLLLVIGSILMWSATGLLYKAGVQDGNEEHVCLKFSVCVGIVFFAIAVIYLIVREEPFSIFESAARYWPMTVFGIIYAIVNTISYKGYVYNEATVVSPVEGISGGASAVLLILAYLALGRAESVTQLLTPLRSTGIALILICVILLSVVRNRENRKNLQDQKPKWMLRGLGTLVFPVIFAVIDGLETVVTGICLDTTFGFAMPEGDSIIIVGMEYAVFALGFWIYICIREKKIYNPFTRRGAPRILGAVADNIGIVLYTYAMAINSVSTDPLLAVYPVFVMLGGRAFMKEKVSKAQYVFLLGIIAGSILVVMDTIS